MEMSVNNSPYPLSSSSSRQSLQKDASRPDTALSRPGDRYPRRQLPEPRSADETNQLPVSVASPCQDATQDATAVGTEDNPEEGHDRPPSHPAFQPFFTLIEDAHTSDYHHPTVHYIFSDDDSDIVTEAALRSLSAQQEALSDSKKDQIAHNTASPLDEAKDPADSAPAKTTLLPPPVPGVRENFIILDVEPSPATETQVPTLEQLVPGKSDTKSLSSSPANQYTLSQEGQHQYRVTGAQSFSSAWQVLNTEVVPAPTFENSNPGESPGHGLMLKIRGTAGLPDQRPKDGEGRGGQRLEDMMDQFAKRMSELQVVIDAAEASSSNAHLHGDLEHPLSPDAAEEGMQDATTGVRQI
ncbi:unnamed protein product [Penicillium salamii]|uniref:Uncharacterized protein n=1 Tax=Penicillium salamii TaxID=1612424 RepID=A0A9W4N8Q4_9EURO|nr:unnamed protein product [Penicillium salamii]CAG8069688.1 unnamed protein product [Penicillium salamii]CAG8265611.1 unnamed protein product [Penicillium salamii]CAG8318074.1 unnamed protein product [Penicillium salamii]CAG8325846.1 unnamed protein product [Penicillium salamii]